MRVKQLKYSSNAFVFQINFAFLPNVFTQLKLLRGFQLWLKIYAYTNII